MNLTHVARVGKITAPTNEAGVIGITQVKTSSWEVRDGVPHSQLFGFASSLLPTCDVVILNLGADNANGCIIASNDQRHRPKAMRGGEVCVYDSAGQKIYLSSSGGVVSINVIGGQQVNLSSSVAVNVTSPNITFNGNVKVNGTIMATGNITAGAVTLQSHHHTNVSTGAGNSGGPVG